MFFNHLFSRNLAQIYHLLKLEMSTDLFLKGDMVLIIDTPVTAFQQFSVIRSKALKKWKERTQFLDLNHQLFIPRSNRWFYQSVLALQSTNSCSYLYISNYRLKYLVNLISYFWPGKFKCLFSCLYRLELSSLGIFKKF